MNKREKTYLKEEFQLKKHPAHLNLNLNLTVKHSDRVKVTLKSSSWVKLSQ